MSSARNCNPADLAGRLRTADAVEFAALLETLMLDVAVPLVRQTVRRRFGSARKTTPEDFEDVCADSLSAIIVRLRRHREGGPEIGDFENYAATVASNTADRFFAARNPQRARLRNRIRYVLTTDSRFAIREFEAGGWVCQLRSQAHSVPLSGVEAELCGRQLAVSRFSTNTLSELVCEILSAAPGALELTELTTFAAHAMGITDRTESVEEHAELLRDPAVPFAHTAELKNWLMRLWAEVCELPLLQRIALLLNLGSGGSSNGGATVCAIADLGIATFGALAASLDITEEDLADIWNRVPLKDNEIAGMLQLERQQVINLRASARQRLGRRMTAIDNAGSRTNIPEQTNTREWS